MTLPLREIEGKYEILHKIKEGGMGAIYKVRHRLLDEVRVIKLIRPQLAQDEELQQRFQREAKTAIRLKHPNIAQIYDFAFDRRGTAYIVMEYIDGVTLAELLAKSGPPSLGLGLEVARQSLRALGYLHGEGYLHRDIATDNIMLSKRYDGTPLVKLIDLGIAKRLGGDELTQTGMFLGKVRYASPEQFGKVQKQTSRSDLYSFGVLLYELLTGRYPITGNGFSEVIAGHLFNPPLDFAESDAEGRLPEGVRGALLKVLAKDPKDRFASAEELIAALAPHGSRPADLRDDLDRTLSTTTLIVTEEPEEDEPGSTQNHLDEQFGLAATPAPTAEATPAPPPAEAAKPRPLAAGADRLRVAALLDNARLMRRLEQLDRAEEDLEELLALAPGHAAAEALLAEVRAADKRPKAARPARGVEESGGAIVDRLAAQVGKTASRPAKKAPPVPASSAEESSTTGASISDRLEQARRLLELGVVEPARAVLRGILKQDPDHAEARALLAEADAAEVPTGAGSKDTAVAEAVQSIERDLAAGRFETAEAALDFALGRYGEDPRLTRLRVLLDQEADLDHTIENGGASPFAPEVDTLELPPAAPPEPRRGGRPLLLAAAAVALLVIAVAVAWMATRSEPAVTTAAAVAGGGILVVDALPWARVEELTDAAGRRHALGDDRYTPLRLTLPAGAYTLTLAPPEDSPPRRVEAEVVAGRTTNLRVDVGRLEAADYFRQAGFR